MNKADFPSLDKFCFPTVDYARSLQTKVKGKWVTIYNFILTNKTCEGRKGMGLVDWLEFEQVTAEYPAGTEFRITSCISLLPYPMILLEIYHNQRKVTPAEVQAAADILHNRHKK